LNSLPTPHVNFDECYHKELNKVVTSSHGSITFVLPIFVHSVSCLVMLITSFLSSILSFIQFYTFSCMGSICRILSHVLYLCISSFLLLCVTSYQRCKHGVPVLSSCIQTHSATLHQYRCLPLLLTNSPKRLTKEVGYYMVLLLRCKPYTQHLLLERLISNYHPNHSKTNKNQ